MTRSAPIALVVYALFASAQHSAAQPRGTGVCVSEGSVNMSYEEWCASVDGSWDGTHCRCDGSGTSSSGGDSYDWVAEQRAAQWRRQQEELERQREEQLQREALEHAEQMARQLEEQDQRGAALGVQARQLRSATEQIEQRETKTATVAKELAPVVISMKRHTAPPPLSASEFTDLSKLPPRRPTVVEVPQPQKLKEPEKTRVHIVEEKAWNTLEYFVLRDQLTVLKGTVAELRQAAADEQQGVAKHLVMKQLKKIPGATPVLSIYADLKRFNQLRKEFNTMGEKLTEKQLRFASQTATYVGSVERTEAPDHEAHLETSADIAREPAKNILGGDLQGAAMGKVRKRMYGGHGW